MVPKICSFEGCERKHFTRGLCNAHRMQLARTGTLKPLKESQWDTSLPDEPRFWQRVDRLGPKECWEWQGCCDWNGYGQFDRKGQASNLAHRTAYEFTVGPIPDGMEIDHICHNRKCVNPAHLRPATRKQNNENPSGLQSNNTSGYRGVSWHKGNQAWAATVQHKGRQVYRAYFQTPEEAAEAARLKRLELFTYNTIDRRP